MSSGVHPSDQRFRKTSSELETSNLCDEDKVNVLR